MFYSNRLLILFSNLNALTKFVLGRTERLIIKVVITKIIKA